MSCKKIKMELKNGANPYLINELINAVTVMDDNLFKSYTYRNKVLYVTLGYTSERCDEIREKLSEIYHNRRNN